jgi:hypothetical protein
MARTRITGNTSHYCYCCVTPRITESTCHMIPIHCCVMSPRMRCINQFSGTNKTLPQFCCMARVLERAHPATVQQCLEQIRHNINYYIARVPARRKHILTCWALSLKCYKHFLTVFSVTFNRAQTHSNIVRGKIGFYSHLYQDSTPEYRESWTPSV